MKILFLVQGHDVASSRFRVFQYLPYLKEHGVEPSILSFPKGFLNKRRIFKGLGKYDILFVQRKRFSVNSLKLIRKNARKIVYDFDDAVMYRNSNADNKESKTRLKMFRNMINASDHVIA